MRDNQQASAHAVPTASRPSEPDWANDPRLAGLAEAFLRRSMQREDTLMLAGYVTSLRKLGMDVGPVYERAREEFPEMPTLAELDEKIAAARAR